MNPFYTELNLKLTEENLDCFKDYIKKSEAHQEFYYPKGTIIKEDLHNKKYNFIEQTSETLIDLEFLKTTTIKYLIDLFPQDLIKAKIVKFPAKKFVSWHIDLTRNVGFNISIFNSNSHTIFAEDYSTQEQIGQNTSIRELQYTPGKIYLFNANRYHAVMNLDEGPRYIIIIFISKQSNLNYESVYNLLLNKSLI